MALYSNNEVYDLTYGMLREVCNKAFLTIRVDKERHVERGYVPKSEEYWTYPSLVTGKPLYHVPAWAPVMVASGKQKGKLYINVPADVDSHCIRIYLYTSSSLENVPATALTVEAMDRIRECVRVKETHLGFMF